MERGCVDRFCVIDFEASSLEGWPIEVGLSCWQDGRAVTWSSLIRPAVGWDPALWSTDAERIHRIDRRVLDSAPPAVEVAAELIRRIAGRRVLSDAPAFDGQWARLLFDAGGISDQPVIEDLIPVAVDLLNRDYDRARAMLARLEAEEPPHRAGEDAERIMTILAEAVAGGQPDGSTPV